MEVSPRMGRCSSFINKEERHLELSITFVPVSVIVRDHGDEGTTGIVWTCSAGPTCSSVYCRYAAPARPQNRGTYVSQGKT